jgi:hypothetical protein
LQTLEKDVSATATHKEVQGNATVLASQVETEAIGREVVSQHSSTPETQKEEKKAEEKPQEEKNFFEKARDGTKETAGKIWDWTVEHKKPLLYTG